MFLTKNKFLKQKKIWIINQNEWNYNEFLLLLHLACTQASRRVDDLFEDLRDGHNLLSLLEVLSGEHLVSIFYCYSTILISAFFARFLFWSK